MIFDPLKPYFAAIRIAGYIIICIFLFSSGCSYGKHKQTVKVAELETALGVCKDANRSQLDTINRLVDSVGRAYFRASSRSKALISLSRSQVFRASLIHDGSPYQIGGHISFPSSYNFIGKISDLIIWDTSLSASDAENLYAQNGRV